jgi:ketosteroid isomerase-like protein
MNTQTLIDRAYAAFNRRDIDGTLALMGENVSWPKASEGGRVVGKQDIRAYWTRQWAEFDPTWKCFRSSTVRRAKPMSRFINLLKILKAMSCQIRSCGTSTLS